MLARRGMCSVHYQDKGSFQGQDGKRSTRHHEISDGLAAATSKRLNSAPSRHTRPHSDRRCSAEVAASRVFLGRGAGRDHESAGGRLGCDLPGSSAQARPCEDSSGPQACPLGASGIPDQLHEERCHFGIPTEQGASVAHFEEGGDRLRWMLLLA